MIRLPKSVAFGALVFAAIPLTLAIPVITTIDINPARDCAGASFTVHLSASSSDALNLEISSQPSLAQLATLQFNYPSGIVFPPGSIPSIQVEPNNGGGNNVFVDLCGYLTNN